MAKKKAAAAGVDPMALKLQGKTFCVAGKFDTYGNDTSEAMTAMITAEGGTIVENVGKQIDFLLIKEPQGKSSYEKKVIQLNLKGASISILDPDQLRAMLVPSEDEVNALFRLGALGHQRLNEKLRAHQFHSRYGGSRSFFAVEGLDLRGQDLKDVPLRCAALDNADLRKARAAFLDAENSGTNLARSNFFFGPVEEASIGPISNSKLDGSQLHAVFVKLTDCSCRDADFSYGALGGDRNPVVRGCDFTNAKLVQFHFGNANLTGSVFHKADLTGADIEGCTASKLDFRQAFLKAVTAQASDFDGADLTQADLSDAELMRCTFRNANLSRAKFCHSLLMHADFKGAKLDGADFTGANVAGADFTDADLSKVKGLPDKPSRVATAGPKLKELSGLLSQSSRLETLIEVKTPTESYLLAAKHLWHHCESTWSRAADPGQTYICSGSKSTFEKAVIAAVNTWPDAVPQAHTFATSSTKLALTPKKLNQLVLEAWYETYGIACPTAADIAELAKAAANQEGEERERLLSDLIQPGGVQRWNEARETNKISITEFPQAQLAGRALDHLVVRHLEFKECHFENASLVEADFDSGIYSKSNFAAANMHGVTARSAKFNECDFTGTNLSDANLSNADLRGAILSKTNLVQAKLDGNLCGANLTGAKLKNCEFGDASFDEATQFPKGFEIPESMAWKGKGIDPRAQAAVAAATSGGPIDMEQFMTIMQASVDVERMKKALSMLKAERFRLFAEANGEHLIGVVKSQNDPDLVYSCRLTKDGQFACCTQNLNNCGGLRGALCKHLLVLIIGMTRGGELDPTLANEWIAASRFKKPELDKDAMSETLLRYKGAEAGEIDWRPMETIPEDYFSL